jgi:hypothetical protein
MQNPSYIFGYDHKISLKNLMDWEFGLMCPDAELCVERWVGAGESRYAPPGLLSLTSRSMTRLLLYTPLSKSLTDLSDGQL